MADIRNSALLDRIMEHAENLRRENDCSALTRDYIIIAAISVLDKAGPSDRGTEEYDKTRTLLANLSRQEDLLKKVLDKWHGKTIPSSEGMILATKRGKSLNTARLTDKKQLTADVFLGEILKDATTAVVELSGDVRKPAAPAAETPAKKIEEKTAEKPAEEKQSEAEAPEVSQPGSLSALVKTVKELQANLQNTVLGQQHAVSVFTSGYFQSELQAAIRKNRREPRATFLFAGPSGVGKTFLAEQAAALLKLPFRRFDMSEYANPNAPDELSGSDANYKSSSEGQLTGFVRKNPRCVLLFDEIEKASLDVIHLFLQILEGGVLRDNKTDREVDFKDAILIFTTNAGKKLYEGYGAENLSAVSRDVILNALAEDINPKTKEPYFPAAICSRFAAGNVVMFNYLDAGTLRTIIVRELAGHIKNIGDSMNIRVSLDDNVPTALLLAEGAMADARSVKSRAGSFFSGELYELFRLISSEKTGGDVDRVRNVNISVNLDREAPEIVSLFLPRERIHAVAWGDTRFEPAGDNELIPVIHYVRSVEEAKKVIAKENVRLVFCDLVSDAQKDGSRWLNLEDRDTEARRFLLAMRGQYPSLPVVLTEPEGRPISEEEKISFLRRGVSGVLPLSPDRLEERLSRYTVGIFQQSNLTELARSNQLLRYETAQSVDADGQTADIVLYDLKMEKAIRAEDAGNVLSLLSTPDVKFDDVIGAEDAKKELKFFISYMRQPNKFRRFGLSSPKGILLYGPPGTGKTMLAKAFAAESKATFIATEGNQFFKGIVGQGAEMVHRLFATARKYAPSVIFIDEIDAVARARSGRDTDMAQDSEQILTALFAEMDGFSTTGEKPVFVLGATNYRVEPGTPMSLDPAMLRRFDRRILVDLPDLESRKKFLKKQFGKKAVFRVSEDGIASLADRSTGMSLAQLASVLDMAVRNAMQKQLDRVDDAALEEAFETFNSGESRKWDPETTLRTARHEAGHALISWLSGEKPSFITIVSRGNYGGYMQYADRENRMGWTRQEMLLRIRTALGGRAAELVCYGEEDGLSTGPSGDLKTATLLAEEILCKYGMDESFGMAVVDREDDTAAEPVRERVNQLLREQLAEARRQILDNRGKLDILVDELLKSNSLRAPEIERVLSGAPV